MHLTWPECLNVRDLGGMPTTSGHITRTGALIRSDNMDRLTPAGIEAVRAAGISRIVDVRSSWECERYPSPFIDDPIWRNTPLADPDTPDEPERSLVDQYITLLDHNSHRFAAAVAEIADAPAGCVVVHCHAGKDRTGIVVALALSLARVRPLTLAADYATVGDSQLDVATLVGTTTSDTATLPELQPPQPATMLATLSHLSDRYGSVEDYLRSGGLTAHQASAARTRLLDSAT